MDSRSTQAMRDPSDPNPTVAEPCFASPATWPLGRSEMAQRIREHDWDETSVGSPEVWPEHIRFAVQLILDSLEPACLWWTTEGFLFYNDAYAVILNTRHPQALGKTLAQVWPEAAHLDDFRHGYVFQTGTAVLLEDRPYVIYDDGVPRERFFTMSGTPIRHPSGSIDAVLQRLTETSDYVGTRQRLRQINSRLGEQRADLAVQLALTDAIADESARQRAEARTELHDREERLRLASMAGRLATWDWHLTSGKVIWSDQMYPIRGFAPEEVEPSFGAWAQRVHPDDLDGLLNKLSTTQSSHQEFEHLFRIVHHDRSVHWCRARGRFFYNKAGFATRMLAVAQDVSEEHRTREQQKLLVAELQHRTRNLLGVIRSLAALTSDDAGSMEQFRSQFADRLDALSRAQGLLSRAGEDSITLEGLIRTEFEALGTAPLRRQLCLDGPEVHLQNSIIQAFALVIHELTTNALKYGALRSPDGRICVRWSLTRHTVDDAQLKLEWQEMQAVPTAHGAWESTGYGRELLEHMLPYVLDAKTTYEITPGGARFVIELPLYIDAHTQIAKVKPAQ